MQWMNMHRARYAFLIVCLFVVSSIFSQEKNPADEAEKKLLEKKIIELELELKFSRYSKKSEEKKAGAHELQKKIEEVLKESYRSEKDIERDVRIARETHIRRIKKNLLFPGLGTYENNQTSALLRAGGFILLLLADGHFYSVMKVREAAFTGAKMDPFTFNAKKAAYQKAYYNLEAALGLTLLYYSWNAVDSMLAAPASHPVTISYTWHF